MKSTRFPIRAASVVGSLLSGIMTTMMTRTTRGTHTHDVMRSAETMHDAAGSLLSSLPTPETLPFRSPGGAVIVTDGGGGVEAGGIVKLNIAGCCC